LLLDVVRGNRTLFMRNDEVESAWGWIDPVLDAWRNSSMELSLYPAGTMGPLEADRLLSKRGHSWHSVDDQ
ncbi:MAG: glucose-6-phosphate dehydrogenase, partial [Alphaproteobacteria bacterium]